MLPQSTTPCACGCGQFPKQARSRYVKGHGTWPTRRKPLAEDFWSNVEKTDTCWLWHGHREVSGYGVLRHEYSIYKAHRLAWQLIVGPLPDDAFVCHRCDNPPCVYADPDPELSHLFIGGPPDNSADMVSKGRQAKGEQVNTAKLTSQQVVEIRQRYSQGSISRYRLGKEYGVSGTNIGEIIARRTWKSVG